MGQSTLPFTDPWVVLGVHQGASREEVKAAFRRAALTCHPDVDPSPSACARFADIKTAADMLLKGQPPPGRPFPGSASYAGAWDPAASAARGARSVPHNRTAALWASLLMACGLAFGYGAFWASYMQKRSNYSSPEEAGERLRNPSPQRRKLLHTLLDDQRVQQRRREQQQQQQQRQQLQQQQQRPSPEAADATMTAEVAEDVAGGPRGGAG